MERVMVGQGDRRAVLQGIGMGALSAALPAAARASGPAQDGQRKLGYAIVGLGSYATGQIMPRMKSCQHSRIVALVSGTPAKLDKYGTDYGVPKTHRYSYADFDRIRDNPDIDIVYVVLPVFLHAEYSIRALKAGKHVLCEKPMAMNVAECQAMIDAAKAADRKLMIGYRCHFEPYNRQAIDWVRSRHVGPLSTLQVETGFSIGPNQWRLEQAKAGGGSMMDIGIYSLNAARYLTGEEPVALSAFETTDKSDPRFREVEDRVSFMLQFPSGVVANCLSSYSSGHGRYRAVGTDGWLELEPAVFYGGHAMRVSRRGSVGAVDLGATGDEQFVRMLDHLALCASTGKTPIVPGEEGLRDIRLIEAIYRSMKERSVINLA
jgi:glucose-fructose oxidoreductase